MIRDEMDIPQPCPDCGQPLQVVRPGKWQCVWCEEESMVGYWKQIKELLTEAEEYMSHADLLVLLGAVIGFATEMRRAHSAGEEQADD